MCNEKIEKNDLVLEQCHTLYILFAILSVYSLSNYFCLLYSFFPLFCLLINDPLLHIHHIKFGFVLARCSSINL